MVSALLGGKGVTVLETSTDFEGFDVALVVMRGDSGLFVLVDCKDCSVAITNKHKIKSPILVQ